MAQLQQILADAGDPNDETRRSAELLLEQAKAANFPQYCMALATELCNEQSPSAGIRQRAGLVLKNAISATDPKSDAAARDRWVAGGAEKPAIKQMVLDLVLRPNTTSEEARRAACQVAAKIARLEVPQNSWPEFFSAIALAPQSTPAARVGAYLLLSYFTEDVQLLCQDWGRDLLTEDHKTFLITHLSRGMTDANEDVKLAALRGFAHAILFADKFLAVDSDRLQLFGILGAALSSTRADVENAAWEILFQIAAEFYRYLSEILPDILALTVQRCGSLKAVRDNESSALSAIEFWSTVCDTELLLLEGSYIMNVKDTLLPVLYEATTFYESEDEAEDPDDWTVPSAAGACITLCAQIMKDAIVPSALQFIDENFASPTWSRRQAAVLIYGSVLDGPFDDKELYPKLVASFPLLCNALNDPSVTVRDNCAWAIGSVAQNVPAVVGQSMQRVNLINLLVSKLTDAPRVAKHVCFALYKIFGNAEEIFSSSGLQLDQHFNSLSEMLIKVAKRPDANEAQLRQAAFHALYMLISECGDAESVAKLLKQFQDWVEDSLSLPYTEELGQLQGPMIGVMNAITVKLGPNSQVLSDEARRLIHLYLRVLVQGTELVPAAGGRNAVKKWSAAADDVFLAISMLCIQLHSGFDVYVDLIVTSLLAALEGCDVDHQLAGIAVEIVGTLASECPSFSKRVPQFVTTLMSMLRDRNTPLELRPKIITTLTDIGLAHSKDFWPHLQDFLGFLIMASMAKVSQGPPDDASWIQYITDLRDATLCGCSMLIFVLRTDAKEGKAALEHKANSITDIAANAIKDEYSTSANIKNALRLLQDLVAFFREDIINFIRSGPIYVSVKQLGQRTNDPEIQSEIVKFEDALARYS